MKFLGLIFSFTFAHSLAFANPAPLKVNCIIQEFMDQTPTETAVSIESSNSTHGAMIFPKLKIIPEVDMMIALHQSFLIVNLYHNPSGISAASHADITGGKNSHTQMILGNGRSLTVSCLRN